MKKWVLTYLIITSFQVSMAWGQMAFAPTPTPAKTKKKISKPQPKNTSVNVKNPAPTKVISKSAKPSNKILQKTTSPVVQTENQNSTSQVKPTATPAPSTEAVANPTTKPTTNSIDDLELDLDVNTKPIASTSQPAAKPTIVIEKPYAQMAYGAMLWQEKIKATRVGESTNIIMQLQGLSVDYTYSFYFRTHPGWRHFYTTQLGAGTVRGQGTTPAIPDQLKGHTWVLGTFEPGVVYETSEVSEVGMALPLTYRKINWALQSESLLEMSKTTSFTAALSLLYINHINKKWDLRVNINNELGWKTTRWGVAGQFLY